MAKKFRPTKRSVKFDGRVPAAILGVAFMLALAVWVATGVYDQGKPATSPAPVASATPVAPPTQAETTGPAPKLPAHKPAAFGWSAEQIEASPEHLAAFIHDRLVYVAAELPDQSYLHFGDSRSVKDRVRDFLAARRLDQELRRVRQGMAAARQGAPLTITLIADVHAGLDDQGAKSKRRQKEIVKFLWKAQPRLFLVEAPRGPMTWASAYTEYCRAARMQGQAITVPDTASFRQIVLAPNSPLTQVWWTSFYDRHDVALVGVDDPWLEELAPDLLESAINGLEPRDLYIDTGLWLMNRWRDWVILGNAVLAMRRHQATEAYAVLGGAHLRTLPPVAERWSVRLKVALPMRADFSVPPPQPGLPIP